MTWRNRNLFKKKAVPVQKFNMGGSVRGVEALKNVAPTLSTFDYDNAVNMMGGGMVDMPVPQMQMGGDPAIELFETGDPTINAPLNTQAVDMMNQTLMTGGGDAIPESMLATETPMTDEVAVTKDQGLQSSPQKEFVDVALQETKDVFQDVILKAMADIERDIDTAEEVSIPEVKQLAALIIEQQQQLEQSAVELAKTMNLNAMEDVTLFDNAFEREVQEKYPMVAAVLEKQLPDIVGVEKVAQATMPSGDTPVATMSGGGDPADATGPGPEDYFNQQLVAAQKIVDDLVADIERLGVQKEDATSHDRKNIASTINRKQQELVIAQQNLDEIKKYAGNTGGGNNLTTGKDAVEKYIDDVRLGGNQSAKTKSFEEVMQDPEVKKLFADYDDYVTKAGLGNIKSRKVGGTSDLIGVRRDMIGGEAKAEKEILDKKVGLLEEIEGDPYGYKQAKLTNTELNIKSGGNIAADDNYAAFVRSLGGGGGPIKFMMSMGEIPRYVRDLAGIQTQNDRKTLFGQEMSFTQLVRMIYEEGLTKSDYAQGVFLEELAKAWKGTAKYLDAMELKEAIKDRIASASVK